VEHAAGSSPSAKLIKLADKLYNLRDLERVSPEGWAPERVQEYYEWAQKVVNELRGTNKKLEDSLDEIFKRHCTS
jgi:guanosine-3',5'-bis(diphosphate) 3'-pyrophosphohydrolase